MKNKNINQNNNPKTWCEILFGKKGSSGYQKLTDPQWTARMGLVFAIIIIVINLLVILLFKKYIPSHTPFDMAPITFGIIGFYFGIKKNPGGK